MSIFKLKVLFFFIILFGLSLFFPHPPLELLKLGYSSLLATLLQNERGNSNLQCAYTHYQQHLHNASDLLQDFLSHQYQPDSKTLIVRPPFFSGQLGSQMNRIVLPSFVLGYLTGRAVIVDTTYFVGGRWCSLFTSFVGAREMPEDYLDVASLGEEVLGSWDAFEGAIAEYDHLFWSNEEEVRKLILEKVKSEEKLLEHFKKLLPVSWYPAVEIQRDVQHWMETFELKDFIGVHVRWGDKKTEATLLDINTYVKFIEDAIGAREWTVFLMSDDYEAHKMLQLSRPRWKVYSLIPEWSSGNQWYQLRYSSLSYREGETKRMIVELTMMTKASHVFCTYSSNVCRLIQVIRQQDANTVYGVEPEWSKWAPY